MLHVPGLAGAGPVPIAQCKVGNRIIAGYGQMQPSLFLTVEETEILTGRAQTKRQIDALRAMGVPFLVNAVGRPVVTRAAVEGPSTVSAATKPAEADPAAKRLAARPYPKGMRARRRGERVHYYLDTGGTPRREIALGKDYGLALEEWARRTGGTVAPTALDTFRAVAERYVLKVLPGKAPATRYLNLRSLDCLLKFFVGPCESLGFITPVLVRQYLDKRATSVLSVKRQQNLERAAAGRELLAITGKEGHVPANREKALFSHIWNFARETGLTNLANPCAGVKGFKEDGRDVYVSDEVLAAVRAVAETPLQDALDLAYLIGQRPADVLKLARADIVDGALVVKQNKTGKKVRVSIEGELAEVIARIKSRKALSLRLISGAAGTPLTRYELRGAFNRARLAAAAAHPDLASEIKAFQFRDLRAKAATDTEELRGMTAAQDQLGHSTPMMTAHYVRHRRGKLVKPTR
jgi:integrase